MNKHNGNDLYIEIIAQAIEEMKEVQGESFSLENVNLAELERRTGITRARLRRMKANGFKSVPHGRSGQKADYTVLSGYTSTLDSLLKIGVTNSVVCLDRLNEMGYTGSLSTVKRYIAAHKYLVPAKRQQVNPQGNRRPSLQDRTGRSLPDGLGFYMGHKSER